MAKMTKSDIDARINYHAPTEKAVELHKIFRGEVAGMMEKVTVLLPECREVSVVYTKLEEALFWINAAIARNHDKL